MDVNEAHSDYSSNQESKLSGQGAIRSFGKFGPKYEITSVSEEQGLCEVRVLESGEQLDYPLNQALADPIAL